jgi:mRNA-degrading endonuclease RelE of RelBE toxin-antitoxin system
MKMKQYTLEIPAEVKRQLRRFRASIRGSIQTHLQEIVDGATARPSAGKKAAPHQGPPLRFYVFEGCRVFYQVNTTARRVVVLELRTEVG